MSSDTVEVAALLEAVPMAIALFGPDRLLRFMNKNARDSVANGRTRCSTSVHD